MIKLKNLYENGNNIEIANMLKNVMTTRQNLLEKEEILLSSKQMEDEEDDENEK